MSDDRTKRLAVFGASGGVGRHVVTDALAPGYEVRAFVRDASKLTVADPRLTVIVGQLDDADRVGEAITGADAVISALGPDLSRGATGMALVDGTRMIVTAMENAGVDRYIGMATPSLRDERDTRSILGTLVPIMRSTYETTPEGLSSALECFGMRVCGRRVRWGSWDSARPVALLLPTWSAVVGASTWQHAQDDDLTSGRIAVE
jgi:nucleoside-diphosphate-sugar epimerase